jgi:hypothetical protein
MKTNLSTGKWLSITFLIAVVFLIARYLRKEYPWGNISKAQAKRMIDRYDDTGNLSNPRFFTMAGESANIISKLFEENASIGDSIGLRIYFGKHPDVNGNQGAITLLLIKTKKKEIPTAQRNRILAKYIDEDDTTGIFVLPVNDYVVCFNGCEGSLFYDSNHPVVVKAREIRSKTLTPTQPTSSTVDIPDMKIKADSARKLVREFSSHCSRQKDFCATRSIFFNNSDLSELLLLLNRTNIFIASTLKLHGKNATEFKGIRFYIANSGGKNTIVMTLVREARQTINGREETYYQDSITSSIIPTVQPLDEGSRCPPRCDGNQLF